MCKVVCVEEDGRPAAPSPRSSPKLRSCLPPSTFHCLTSSFLTTTPLPPRLPILGAEALYEAVEFRHASLAVVWGSGFGRSGTKLLLSSHPAHIWLSPAPIAEFLGSDFTRQRKRRVFPLSQVRPVGFLLLAFLYFIPFCDDNLDHLY